MVILHEPAGLIGALGKDRRIGGIELPPTFAKPEELARVSRGIEVVPLALDEPGAAQATVGVPEGPLASQSTRDGAAREQALSKQFLGTRRFQTSSRRRSATQSEWKCILCILWRQ